MRAARTGKELRAGLAGVRSQLCGFKKVTELKVVAQAFKSSILEAESGGCV